jgi:hypothetical protein
VATRWTRERNSVEPVLSFDDALKMVCAELDILVCMRLYGNGLNGNELVRYAELFAMESALLDRVGPEGTLSTW